MKESTKRLHKLQRVDSWLKKARPDIELKTHLDGWQPEFSLLIAVEQLLEYTLMLEKEITKLNEKVDKL